MGKSKESLFTAQQIEMARLAKAIAHPARVAILQYLIEKGSCVCGDIVDEIPLSQATVSQHLKALKEAGIIKGSVDGSYRCYCVDNACCQQLGKMFSGLISRLVSCC